jgi:hypothetical protein
LATTRIEPYDDLFQEIITAQAINIFAAQVRHGIVRTPIFDIPDLHRMDELEKEPHNKWRLTAGFLTLEDRTYVSKDDWLCNKALSHLHYNVQPGHFEDLKTDELVTGHFISPTMESAERKFIAG